jgi:hypothetical protein
MGLILSENDHDFDFNDCPMVAGPTPQYFYELCSNGLEFNL